MSAPVDERSVGECARRLVERSCAAQGLPTRISDASVVQEIVRTLVAGSAW